ncbi:MAG: SGNH/GDSL hydrolase family protein [Planctomycetes bacterium]|nr:SGNH/GDSL hydrolase family protein [Planctomycetota bacterium]
MPAARPRRRLLFGLIAALLGLAVAVLAVEVLLLVFDPTGRNYHDEFTTYRTQCLRYTHEQRPLGEAELDGTLYRHKPSLDLDVGSFTIKTNALGFRGPEIAVPKPAGTFRIVVLGDSVAFGWGVDDEVTFLRRLERELNARGGTRIEVVNTGHNMYDSMQQAALLRDEGMALQPDLVLLVYVVNDIEPTRDVFEQAVLGKPADPGETVVVPGDFWTGLADLCEGFLPATAAFLRTQSNESERLRRALPAGAEYVPELFGKGPRGWPRSQRALLDIRDRCQAAGVPLLLLDNSLPAVRALPGFCKANGIDYDELRFAEADFALGITNSRLDTHANAKGHGLLLERLQAALARRSLLPK